MTLVKVVANNYIIQRFPEIQQETLCILYHCVSEKCIAKFRGRMPEVINCVVSMPSPLQLLVSINGFILQQINIKFSLLEKGRKHVCMFELGRENSLLKKKVSMLKEDQYKLLVPTQKRRKAWLGWCIWFCEHESFKNNSENEETLCNTAEQWFHLLKNATQKNVQLSKSQDSSTNVTICHTSANFRILVI